MRASAWPSNALRRLAMSACISGVLIGASGGSGVAGCMGVGVGSPRWLPMGAAGTTGRWLDCPGVCVPGVCICTIGAASGTGACIGVA
eukprot:9607714-Alexandrium_andersonii.AAC.1